jgi:ABC-type dipeptide/oligopeptide/nickel transport system permease subunit
VRLLRREKEFVEAARCAGVPVRVIVHHILPTPRPRHRRRHLGVGSAILTESSIRFWGWVPPNMPTWGGFVGCQDYLDPTPHWALFPGLMIFRRDFH